VEEALAANPEIDAMRERARSLEALVQAAGTWPDATVAVELSNQPALAPLVEQHGMSGVQLKLQQSFRPPRWSRLQREVAAAQAEVGGWQLEEARLDLRYQVEATWYRLVLSRLLRVVTASHLERTEELLAAVRARYEVGQAGQHAALRLELLRDRLEDELGDFERADRELSAGLNRALSREGGVFETPLTISHRSGSGDPEVWMEQALRSNPSVARLGVEGRAEQARAEWVRVDALPDVTVWGGYRIRYLDTESDPGTNLVSLGVSVPLSILSARAGRALAESHERAAQAIGARKTALLDALRADLQAVQARLDRARDKARTYGEVLLPQARTTLETTLNDFMVGKADFASLYEAEVDLLNLERARLQAAVESHLQWSLARTLVGAEPEVRP
jgi:outer membrane protein TolC